MRAWKDRAPEVAHLHNPAFCAEVCRRVAFVYADRMDGKPLPAPVLFLALPILLHAETREAFSHLTRQKMHAWLQERPELRVGFARRVRQFAPHTLEGLSFLVCTGSARFDGEGLSPTGPRPTSITGRDDVVADVFRKASAVGRWLAAAGSPEAAYTTWGVQP